MFSNLVLALLAYLIGRRSTIFFVVSSLLIFVYYYPLVLSDTVFIWDYNNLNQYEVGQLSKFYILAVFFLLLILGCFAKNEKIQCGDPNSLILKSSLFDFVFIIFIFSAHLFEVWGAIGSNDKIKIMEMQSYVSNISDASLLFVFGLSLIKKSKPVTTLVVLLGLVEAFLGFRYVVTHMIVIYLLYRSIYSIGLDIKSWIFLFSATLLIIIIKLTNYSIPSLEDTISFFDLCFDDACVQYLFSNRFNPESSSISVVFNEIVSTNFIVPSHHYTDLFVSLFPFGSKLFNYEVAPYAQYFKDSIFGVEAESFASGVFAFYYSIFGVLSFFIFTALHYIIAYALYRAIFIKNRLVETKSFLLSLVAILLCYALRSDFVYLFTLIRSLFLAYVCYIILRMILCKNHSILNPS